MRLFSICHSANQSQCFIVNPSILNKGKLYFGVSKKQDNPKDRNGKNKGKHI